MPKPIFIKRIDARRADAPSAIKALRDQLSPRGDIVSSRGRQLTMKVFGKPLSPRQVVEQICADVQENGLNAVLEYTRKLDDVDVNPETLRVSEDELRRAHAQADPDFLAAVGRIANNIRAFQEATLHRDVRIQTGNAELGLLYRPVDRVGCCIPGGAAAYPSTILMTVVPAQTAGVRQIAVIAPPTPFGANNLDVQATCWQLGVTEVYRAGGAHAVAMLAYGVDGVEPVDKIVGPGNMFVALAKQHVSDRVGIDMIAGPTEVVVIADDSADPDHIAADLISQAEHAPGASILITWSDALADAVTTALPKQLDLVDRTEQARESLETYGAMFIAEDEKQACDISNQIAPEHLALVTTDPDQTLARIRHAGAIFVGRHTPVAVGDYVAGPSHTLPTGGTARFASGLSANDFLKRSSVIRYTQAQLAAVADDLRLLAAKEGLTAHSQSVDIRLK